MGWTGCAADAEGAPSRYSFASRSGLAVVQQIASSPIAEAHSGKHPRLMLSQQLGRLAEPISE
jgi:hypothetical protein